MLKMLRVRDVVDETIDLGWSTAPQKCCRSCLFIFLPCTSSAAHSGASLVEDGERLGRRRDCTPARPPEAAEGRRLSGDRSCSRCTGPCWSASAFLFHPTARPNLLQSVFLIGVKIVAIAFIAIIIGQVKAVMEEISSDDPDKKAQLKVLDRYLERHAVPGGSDEGASPFSNLHAQ